MRRGLALAAVILFGSSAALVIANACSLVTSYDGFGGATPCGGRIPAKPSGPSGGNEGTAYVGALSFIDFIGSDAGKPYGWDLDGLCTCPDKAACRNPLGANKPCDFPSGTAIDNQAGLLLGKLFQGADQSGPLDYGMGIRLTRYNGGADDSDVEVELYNVVHAYNAIDGGAPIGDGKDFIVVDGTTIAVDATLGSGYVSTEAYVVGRRLVSSFESFKLRLRTPSPSGGTAIVDAPLTAPLFIATIDVNPAGGLHSTDAQLVGRMNVTDVFEAVSHYGICQDAATFQSTHDFICNNVDLPTKPIDNGRDIACDAISIAIGMRVAPCRLAPETGTPLTLTSKCGQEPPVSCN